MNVAFSLSHTGNAVVERASKEQAKVEQAAVYIVYLYYVITDDVMIFTLG